VSRPKQFERDTALELAMKVFWQRGYANTSIDDLVRETGVGRQSLYDTFGDKKAIYLHALARYGEHSKAVLEASAARAAGGPRAVLAHVFRVSAENIGLCSKPGCLMVNATLEAAPSDDEVQRCVASNLKLLQRTFHDLLVRADKAGELGPGQDLRAIARCLVNAIYGLRLTARATGDRTMVRDVIEQTLSTIR
jgi:TetR/AcrR family transcriptional repressor of nem operon